MNVFSVLSQHMDWLSQRQAVSANNVANVDTPGYRSRQVAAFDIQTLVTRSPSQLAATSQGHIQASGAASADSDTQAEISFQNNPDVSVSGNDVMIEKEMGIVGETSRMMSFDTGIERMFQHMYNASLK